MPPVRWCSAVAARIRRRSAGDRRQQRRGLRGGEAIQPYVGDRVPAFHPGQQAGHRLAAGHLVRPVRADEQPRPALVGDPLEQRRALRVGPVQVLEDDDRGRVADQVGQDGEAGVQPLDRAAPRVGQRRQLLLVDLRAAVDGVQEHLVRPGQRAGLGLTDQHHGLRRHGRQQLVHQPGLADARLARDERDRRLTRRSELRQSAQLALPPDHHRAGTAADGSHDARVPVGCPRTTTPFLATAGRAGHAGAGEQVAAVGLGDQLTVAFVRQGQHQIRVHQHGLSPCQPLMDPSSVGKGAATSEALTYLRWSAGFSRYVRAA